MGEEACERAERYIEGAVRALASVRRALGQGYERLLDAASRYIEDADYYLSKGDCDTALAAVSYAEGLLDALKYLGVVEPEWPPHARPSRPKVFVAGTFDLLHPGHIELLEYASNLGELHVVVARDSTVERLKGRPPLLNEGSRLRVVSSIRYVKKAYLGDERDMLAPLERIKPDIVVLGPDQPFEEEKLAEMIAERTGKRPKVLRYPAKGEFQPGMKGSSDIIRRICCESYCRSIGCSHW